MAPASLMLAGAVHLLPVSGVLGADALASLYGVAPDEPNLELLMRHRAVLFGILGLLLIASAFRVSLRPAALLAGFASVTSFLWLAATASALNGELATVVVVDLVVLASLAIGAVAWAAERRIGVT